MNKIFAIIFITLFVQQSSASGIEDDSTNYLNRIKKTHRLEVFTILYPNFGECLDSNEIRTFSKYIQFIEDSSYIFQYYNIEINIKTCEKEYEKDSTIAYRRLLQLTHILQAKVSFINNIGVKFNSGDILGRHINCDPTSSSIAIIRFVPDQSWSIPTNIWK